jgi:enoyl-CoA hydratase/carnithine racemase
MVSTTRVSLSLIKVEQSGGIATVTINRPGALNGVTPAVVHQLQEAFACAAEDREVQGIVIAGEGNAFVVGADIGFFLRNIEAGDIPRIVKFTEAGHRLLNMIDSCPKPVVARVQGVALGAGVEIALACDHIVASPRASFGFPETGLGIYPGFGGTQRTPRAIGVGLAKWLIFAGKTLSAGDAWRAGLIDRVVPHEELEGAGRACARGELPGQKCADRSPELLAIERFFAANRADALRAGSADTAGNPVLVRAMRLVVGKSPLALRHAEMLIDEGMQRSLAEGLQMEIDHAAESLRSEDAYRGLSFCARRQVGHPEFVGR